MPAVAAVVDTVLAVLTAGTRELPAAALVRGGEPVFRARERSLAAFFGGGLLAVVTPAPKCGDGGAGAVWAGATVPRVVTFRFWVWPPLNSRRVLCSGMAYSWPAGLPGSTCTPGELCAHAAPVSGHRLEAATKASTVGFLRDMAASMPNR